MQEDLNFNGVLFDLDGTLLDTLQDLADSMNTALERLGEPSHPVESYRYFVGDGVRREAERALPEGHRGEELIEKCVEIAMAEYEKCWSENTRPYAGVPELLGGIEELGLGMSVLSNKPDEFVQVMVEKLLGEWKFEVVLGLKEGSVRKPDPGSAIAIAEKMGVSAGKMPYVGDTGTDMQTAVSAGMYGVGALWGFRDAEELSANGAKVLVDKPAKVLGLLSGKC